MSLTVGGDDSVHTVQRQSHHGHLSLRIIAILSLAVLLFSACRDEMEILPIEDQLTYVGEDLRVPIRVRNAGSETVEYWFTGPSLTNIDRWTHLVVTDDGAEFQWSPTAEHVGRHMFLFVASTASAEATRSVWIEVLAAREAAPVFDEPPAGRAFDLSREPCISFPVKVHDGDSDLVQLSVLTGLPEGAEIRTTGPLTAEFRWCPSPDQVAAAERWLITFSASDNEHDLVLHDFAAVLVAPKKPGCEGSAPVINWLYPDEGEHVVSFVGYDVGIEVADDAPLRDPPVLLYTTGRLEQRDQLDVRRYDVEPFRRVDDHWVAHIPSFVLATDEFLTVTMIPWVTDNNDSRGTRCDHRADIRSRRFVALGAVEAGVLPNCAPCVQSGDCQSGVCLANPYGGRCVPACSHFQGCDVGRCRVWNAAEGVVRFACGDVGEVCEGLSPCEDDDFEDNDDRSVPTELSEGDLSAMLCERDPDSFEIKADRDSRIRVSFATTGPEDGLLELHLTDPFGAIVAVSDGSASEPVEHCVPAGESVSATVLAPSAGRNHYSLTVERSDESCGCQDDDFEPDNADFPAPLAESIDLDGVICPGNTDYFALRGDPDARTRVELVFDGSVADLDMDLIDSDGALIGLSLSSGDAEVIETDLPDTRDYLLRVFSFDARGTAYILRLERTPLQLCADTLDCTPGEICSDGQCRRVPCEQNLDCPSGHVCPLVNTQSTSRTCLETCTGDVDCRHGEVCKQFFEGSVCYPDGQGLTGTGCETADDCAGNRACIDWPGGYCAAGGCDRGDFCDDSSLCAIVDGRPVCVVDCWVDDDICDRPDQYQCGELVDPDNEVQFGCYPQSR